MFFPQLCHAEADDREADDMDSEKDEQERQVKKLLSSDTKLQSQVVLERINKIEKALKHKLQSNYESVRKAFLSLDTDHDGYITVEDFLRTFGDFADLHYNDLRKLILSKSTKNQGKISYEDF